MTIQAGQPLPDATLSESIEFTDACPASPAKLSAAEAARGKRIVVFGLPGAFTPTCSSQHVPGYLAHLAEFKSKKVDEIWCVSVNDGYVMAAWGRDQKGIGKIRFLGDGAGEWTKKLGLETEIPGMGLRMKRFSMLVDNGVVKQVNVEGPGKFEVSNAETMLKQI